MHLTTLVGVAAVVSIVAAPAMAEMRGQWQPADCASLEVLVAERLAHGAKGHQAGHSLALRQLGRLPGRQLP